MNNEIKEILEILKKCYDLKDENFDNYITLYQLGMLYDYIINLQQENKIKDTNWESLKYYLEKLYYKDYIEEAISDDIDKKIKELESKVEIKGYQKDIKALQQENEYLKKTNDEKTKIGIADHKYASQMEEKVILLQQENERLKAKYDNNKSHEVNCKYFTTLYSKATKDIVIDDLVYKCEDLDNLKKSYEKLYIEKENYKSRCEKATEITENLLKTEKSGYYQIIFKQQLNILQNGSEKDDR